MWILTSAVAFLVQMMLVEMYSIKSLRPVKVMAMKRLRARIEEQGGFQAFGGVLESLYFELMPPFAGFLAVALIRTKFIMKEKLSVANLFSGLGDMFQGIKNSFKTTEK
jgi:hypothetical protein